LYDALRYGTSTTIRWLMALAATIHGILIVFSPPEDDAIWAAIFFLDAFCLWWRIFDPVPRVWWAYTINIATVALWGSVTYGFAVTGTPLRPPLPILTGYIILTLMALIMVFRTEATRRDRGTA
jgi:hypothetical protein